METKLCLITEIAKRDRKCRFNNVMHLLNVDSLWGCFYSLKRNKASGIDGVTFEMYEKNLAANLQDLVDRMKRFSYRPQPVRRSYIPKSGGKQRPLGIPALEDKIVQVGLTRILQAIYEVDFLDVSFGFRPGQGCHTALDRLDKIIMGNPVNYIIDADIKGFFDHVDHSWLIRCLEERISDKHFLRYIIRFLKAGVMEAGHWFASDEGTPQGGNISPILANIYLHYVLDLWLDKRVKPQSRCYVEMVRYADDFVICVQNRGEANRILAALTERLAKFNLTLSAEKTKVIAFGRYAAKNAKQRKQRPETFNFLGFTHFCDKTRKGWFKVGRVTDRKKFREKIKAMNIWLRSIRNRYPLREWWPMLCVKLRGHYQYYGVSGNMRGIRRFHQRVRQLAFEWLNRRSQKRSANWEEFNRYLERFPLPQPKIYHNFYTLYGYQREYG